MRASKEEAAKAITLLRATDDFTGRLQVIEFLEAAKRKLPSEAAYQAERIRRRKPST